VLKPRPIFGRPLTETSPVDRGNLGRGPYVWGKAEAEFVAAEIARQHGIGCKTVRLGPLVDFSDFAAPGRLGREVGPLYVAVGSKRNHLSVCDVRTAAKVLRHYVERFDSAPAMLNLVEAPAPTRGDLVRRLRERRPDLSVMWLPGSLLWLMSWSLKGVLRLIKPHSKPLDLYAAFASERYDGRLAAEVIAAADAAQLPAPTAIAGNA
jgi:nucleoside-diphosphate-sugar epimerase